MAVFILCGKCVPRGFAIVFFGPRCEDVINPPPHRGTPVYHLQIFIPPPIRVGMNRSDTWLVEAKCSVWSRWVYWGVYYWGVYYWGVWGMGMYFDELVL